MRDLIAHEGCNLKKGFSDDAEENKRLVVIMIIVRFCVCNGQCNVFCCIRWCSRKEAFQERGVPGNETVVCFAVALAIFLFRPSPRVCRKGEALASRTIAASFLLTSSLP